MARPCPIDLRDRLLDAAEAVIVRQGIANLTLDAVAAEAGMSKGGLLHHFPSKDRLIQGLVARCAEYWRTSALEARQEAPEGPGRMARGLLIHGLSDAESWTETCRRSSCAVFSALAQDPALIEPMRAAYAEIHRQIAGDGLPPGLGEAIAAAMNGLWMYRVLGLVQVDQELIDRVRRALEDVVARSVAERPGAAQDGKTRRRGRADAKRPRSDRVRRGKK